MCSLTKHLFRIHYILISCYLHQPNLLIFNIIYSNYEPYQFPIAIQTPLKLLLRLMTHILLILKNTLHPFLTTHLLMNSHQIHPPYQTPYTHIKHLHPNQHHHYIPFALLNQNQPYLLIV